MLYMLAKTEERYFKHKSYAVRDNNDQNWSYLIVSWIISPEAPVSSCKIITHPMDVVALSHHHANSEIES